MAPAPYRRQKPGHLPHFAWLCIIRGGRKGRPETWSRSGTGSLSNKMVLRDPSLKGEALCRGASTGWPDAKGETMPRIEPAVGGRSPERNDQTAPRCGPASGQRGLRTGACIGLGDLS